jgi:hypothetical protein
MLNLKVVKIRKLDDKNEQSSDLDQISNMEFQDTLPMQSKQAYFAYRSQSPVGG